MKKVLTILCCTVIFITLKAQSYRVTWGDEIKVKKGVGDINIITADHSGLYFTEERETNAVVFGPGFDISHKLYKLDKNFAPVFDKEYKKELKGYSFHSFQALGNEIYLFATDYIKKDKVFKVFASKIDKNSGDLLGVFSEIGTYQLESKRDDYEMKISTIQDGKAFLAVANISGKESVSLGICVLDNNLKKKENAVINLAIEPGRYSLQDVQFTKANKIVVLGKEFIETNVGKKKNRLVFKQYTMGIFNNSGVKEKDINLNAGDKFLIGGKLIEAATGEMLLAGFFSNASKKDELNGFFISKIDLDKSALKVNAFKEINTAMLGKSFEDPTDEDDEIKEIKKQKEKAKDEDREDFPNSFIIKTVDINPADNSIIITSEVSQYSYNFYTTTNFDKRTNTWSNTTTHIHRFTNKDILVINADKDGSIRWINDIPKSQMEAIRTSHTSSTNFGYSSIDFGNYFAKGGGMPFYSSYTSLLTNNSLVLLVNDHASNTAMASYGDKVKTIYNFKKNSNAYGISIDLATGKMIKKFVAENNNDVIFTPRHALVVGNEIFMPSLRMHALSKTELKFARIAVKI